MSSHPSSPFLQALAGRVPSRRPCWFMRQAGRCLPEYRALRERHGFGEMLHDADVATDVTLMPLARFDLDAAILFTDLLVPLEAMGIGISFQPAPVLARTVRSSEDLAGLVPFDAETQLPVPLQTARQVRARLPHDKALIGFVGAPWTLAAYLVEGRGSKDWGTLRRMAWKEPELFDALLGRLADAALAFGLAQARAGCDAVQIFDSWAGVAEPGLFARAVVPHVTHIVRGLQTAGVPVIYFVNGAAPHLAAMASTEADGFGIDWRLDIAVAHATLPTGCTVQGNLDPQALFSPAERIAAETRRIVRAVEARPHVFNVGHGLDPETPLGGIEQVLRTLRELDVPGTA